MQAPIVPRRLPAAYFEESFSVGATRSDNYISGFSSRGPVLIDGSYQPDETQCERSG